MSITLCQHAGRRYSQRNTNTFRLVRQRSCLGNEEVLAKAVFVLAHFAKALPRLKSRDEKPWDELLMLIAKIADSCRDVLCPEE
jgi:hypothetical protein